MGGGDGWSHEAYRPHPLTLLPWDFWGDGVGVVGLHLGCCPVGMLMGWPVMGVGYGWNRYALRDRACGCGHGNTLKKSNTEPCHWTRRSRARGQLQGLCLEKGLVWPSTSTRDIVMDNVNVQYLQYLLLICVKNISSL